jgi:hypothetical protein
MSDRSTKVNLENDQEEVINPATEDKQDDIITKLTSLDGKDFSTEAKQDIQIGNQTDGTQRTKIYAN